MAPTVTSSGRGRLPEKIALVTGAARGIGQSTSALLGAEGAAVACCDIDLAGAQETAAAITAAGGSALALALDVTAETAWQDAMAAVLDRYGRLDIVVNCAGIAAACPVAELALEDWRRVMAVNLEGVVLGTKHAIRAMRQTSPSGSIVNVSSVSGVKAQPGASAYCASKAAVIMFTKVAALECLRDGHRIRVNCVSPSGVKTPMWRTMPFFQDLMAQHGSEEAAFQAMVAASPSPGRWAEPEEIAAAILYLASDESLYVNGTNLVMDNGDTA
jgi:NAD(P)-dependent dehydrogenase (short-subunit alcohol dehydrogenase family)